MGRKRFRQKELVNQPEMLLDIKSLDLEGRGIAHLEDGKVVFVTGALPSERVLAQVTRTNKRFDEAKVTQIISASSDRQTPPCQYFNQCGGCALQNAIPQLQVAVKQRVLEDNLKRIGRIQSKSILSPISGPSSGYRYRGRLSVRMISKKGGALVGFREKNGRYIMDMASCYVLPKHISSLIPHLRHMVSDFSINDRIPQIEFSVGHHHSALLIRHMDPFSVEDEALIKAFSDSHQIDIWLQSKGPDTAQPFYPKQERLHYELPEFGVSMPYRPTDFTQVNFQINRVLVSRAIRLLDIQDEDIVCDLFCGLGNFTLPLATKAKKVIGIEGSDQLIIRAQANACLNHLDHKTTFYCRNLFEITANDLRMLPFFDKMLIDPPRDGAIALCEAISEIEIHLRPKRIVYVSCNPATLARDAGILSHDAGYILAKAGIVNMFPHTAHVESIALFELDPELAQTQLDNRDAGIAINFIDEDNRDALTTDQAITEIMSNGKNMKIKTLEQLIEKNELAGKKVFIRADLNCPLDENNQITDDTRIRASMRAIEMALAAGAAVMVTSHLGRPVEGVLEAKDSLKPIAERIAELLNGQYPVSLQKDWVDGVQVQAGEVVVLENCRVNPGEKSDSPELSQAMAKLCDIYVNDAFGTAHRAEATTHGIAKFAPIAVAGPLMAAEIDALTKALLAPKMPLVAIVAGSKVSTKLTILKTLAEKVDFLIVGGGIANTFMAASGTPIGKSLVEMELLEEAREIMDIMSKRGATVPLPTDVVVADEFSKDAKATVKSAEDVEPNEMILDIGPQTAALLAKQLEKAGTIVWNGPVGVFEFEQFAKGTEVLALAIAKSQAFSIAGGGDTLAAISKYNISEQISYISTGGGAFLEFLEGKDLPAILALEARA